MAIYQAAFKDQTSTQGNKNHNSQQTEWEKGGGGGYKTLCADLKISGFPTYTYGTVKLDNK